MPRLPFSVWLTSKLEKALYSLSWEAHPWNHIEQCCLTRRQWITAVRSLHDHLHYLAQISNSAWTPLLPGSASGPLRVFEKDSCPRAHQCLGATIDPSSPYGHRPLEVIRHKAWQELQELQSACRDMRHHCILYNVYHQRPQELNAHMRTCHASLVDHVFFQSSPDHQGSS